MKKIAFAVIILFLTASLSISQDTRDISTDKLVRDLVIGDHSESTAAARELETYPIDSLISWLSNFNDYPQPDSTGTIVDYKHEISDSLQPPYYVYLPSAYNSRTPTPLIVWLHGGVSRPDFATDAGEYYLQHPVVEVCESEGWIVLIPMARHDCLWWNDLGMKHLLWIIREIKRIYNIDDDRVALCGFSDGGSGAFHFAMLQPTEFAMFFPWSGHIAVGSLSGGMNAYVPNMRNRPLFAVNGGQDGLYPSERMFPLIKLAVDNGVDLTFVSYDTAGHNPGYFSEELPLFEQRVKSTARRAFRPAIYWEVSDLNYGKIDWLEITAIDTVKPAADWHSDINYTLTDERITIGFMPDMEFEEEGVRVASLSDNEEFPARKMDLQVNDIVIQLDDIPVKSMQDLNKAKATKKRGEDISITVRRGDEQLVLSATLPPARDFPAFKHEKTSGVVDAVRIGNRFEIKTSRVADFSIYINPEMIRMDQPVIVSVDNYEVFNNIIEPDTRLMLKSFIENRDRRLLWAGRIDVKL